MKYYTYIDMDGKYTLSEAEILSEYWEYWYKMTLKKFTKEEFWTTFTPADCVDNWCIIHWAVETDKDGNEIT